MNKIDAYMERFTQHLNRLLQTVKNPHTDKLFTPADLDSRTAELGHRVSHPHIHRLLNGSSNNPSMRAVVALARAFDVSPSLFFEDNLEGAMVQMRSDESTDADELEDFVKDLRSAIRRVEKQHGITVEKEQ